jgi:hypothetical protein
MSRLLGLEGPFELCGRFVCELAAGGVGAVVLALVWAKACPLVECVRRGVLVEAGGGAVPEGGGDGLRGPGREADGHGRVVGSLAPPGVEVADDGGAGPVGLGGLPVAGGSLGVEVPGLVAELFGLRGEIVQALCSHRDTCGQGFEVAAGVGDLGGVPPAVEGSVVAVQDGLGGGVAGRSLARPGRSCVRADSICWRRTWMSAALLSCRLTPLARRCSASRSWRILVPGSG